MPNSIVTADQDALVTEIEVAAPPSRVFEALTDAKQIFGGGEAKVLASRKSGNSTRALAASGVCRRMTRRIN